MGCRGGIIATAVKTCNSIINIKIQGEYNYDTGENERSQSVGGAEDFR